MHKSSSPSDTVLPFLAQRPKTMQLKFNSICYLKIMTVNRPNQTVDHSPHPSVKAQKAQNFTSTSPTHIHSLLHGNFTITVPAVLKSGTFLVLQLLWQQVSFRDYYLVNTRQLNRAYTRKYIGFCPHTYFIHSPINK
jgi:hypothetical protein